MFLPSAPSSFSAFSAGEEKGTASGVVEGNGTSVSVENGIPSQPLLPEIDEGEGGEEVGGVGPSEKAFARPVSDPIIPEMDRRVSSAGTLLISWEAGAPAEKELLFVGLTMPDVTSSLLGLVASSLSEAHSNDIDMGEGGGEGESSSESGLASSLVVSFSATSGEEGGTRATGGTALSRSGVPSNRLSLLGWSSGVAETVCTQEARGEDVVRMGRLPLLLPVVVVVVVVVVEGTTGVALVELLWSEDFRTP